MAARTESAEIFERITTTIAARHDQGITDDQMIRASGLDPARFAQLAAHGLDGSVPAGTGELMALCEGLFVDFEWLLTGHASVAYSPCSLQRLFDAHYARL